MPGVIAGKPRLQPGQDQNGDGASQSTGDRGPAFAKEGRVDTGHQVTEPRPAGNHHDEHALQPAAHCIRCGGLKDG